MGADPIRRFGHDFVGFLRCLITSIDFLSKLAKELCPVVMLVQRARLAPFSLKKYLGATEACKFSF